MYMQESPDKNRIQTHWNLIGRKITVPPPVLPSTVFFRPPPPRPLALY